MKLTTVLEIEIFSQQTIVNMIAKQIFYLATIVNIIAKQAENNKNRY
jgi:hypothetical protein